MCKELIKSEYMSEMSLPQIITLDLFQHYFMQINGIVTHYALQRIFSLMRGARALTNEEKEK